MEICGHNKLVYITEDNGLTRLLINPQHITTVVCGPSGGSDLFTVTIRFSDGHSLELTNDLSLESARGIMNLLRKELETDSLD